MMLHMPRQMPAHNYPPWSPSVTLPVLAITPSSAPSGRSHSQPQHPQPYPPPALPRISEIAPGLFVGDISAAESAHVLAAHRITHVVSAMRGAVHVPAELALRRLQVPLDDLPFSELAAYLPATTAFIQDALRADPAARVLVHCVQGISRSASVAAAYLMARYNWTAINAVKYIKSKRAVDPNLGFIAQLQEYETVLCRPPTLSSQPPSTSVSPSPPPPPSLSSSVTC